METTEQQRAIDATKSLPEQATIEDAIERLCIIGQDSAHYASVTVRQLIAAVDQLAGFLEQTRRVHPQTAAPRGMQPTPLVVWPPPRQVPG